MKPGVHSVDTAKQYRHVFIVESRDWWAGCSHQFDPALDIVFTYDFALRREIESRGGNAFYVDHLLDNAVMEDNNFRTYRFFRGWHQDAAGHDLFTYGGVPFGFSFRIQIWNDLVFYVRARLCLQQIVALRRDALYVGTQLRLLETILDDLGLPYVPVQRPAVAASAAYYFPIHRWMDEQVRSPRFRHKVRPFLAVAVGLWRACIDRIPGLQSKAPAVFVQEYYPTAQILRCLQQDKRLRVVLGHYSGGPGGVLKYFRERPIPVWGSVAKFQEQADRLMQQFGERRCATLVLSDGQDVSAGIFRIIENRIAAHMATTLGMLDRVIRYLDRMPLTLEVMIATLGQMNMLVHSVCKQRGIPSYLIVNGILAHAYLDEAKDASRINAYSRSIRENYFRDVENVVCLGDPRMDAYAVGAKRRQVDRTRPRVTIGASGHNNTNLSSYVAVEFDFLHDVLQALQAIKARGVDLGITIKVRDNGYRSQYESFVQEYFPGLVEEVVDRVAIRSVLERTDFYISIYSQTLFEASCLGIPCLYYKKDDEILFAPFDGRSELVTVGTTQELVTAVTDFLAGHDRFEAFLQKPVMEKYIGPLDGGNVERNLDYIYGLLQQPVPVAVAR